MSFKAGERVPEGNGEKATGEPKFGSPDELIAFARGYFASDFPNPEQTGCPAPGAVSEVVRAGKQPDAVLRAHLFGCSQCFTEFERELRARRDVQPAVSWWDRLLGTRSLRPAPLLAGALCLLLVALAGIYLRRVYWIKPTPRVSDEHPNPVSAPPDEAPKDNSTAPTTPRVSPTQVAPAERADKLPRPGANARHQMPSVPRPHATRRDAGEPVAVDTVKVDLEEYTALRGEESRESAIRLSRSPTRLELTLPEGSVKGWYNLSILDPSGKAIVTVKARSTFGKTLNAVLDTRKLAPQKYRLRLLREGEAPQYYPVVVGEGAKTAPRVRDP